MHVFSDDFKNIFGGISPNKNKLLDQTEAKTISHFLLNTMSF